MAGVNKKTTRQPYACPGSARPNNYLIEKASATPLKIYRTLCNFVASGKT